MPELRRTLRTTKTQRANPFGPSHIVEEEDDYTLEAETMDDLCVGIKTIEREVTRMNIEFMES